MGDILKYNAIKWFFAGAKLTSPVKSRELVWIGNGKNRKVVGACAIGAMQVGYAEQESKRRRLGSPTNFTNIKRIRDNSNGFWSEVDELLSAYETRYGNPVQYDNDNFGRDFVAKRLSRL